MVREIMEDSTKISIAASILNALPDWFGVTESRLNYINESGGLPMWAYYDGGDAVGFISMRENSPYAAEIHVMGVLPDRHRPPVVRRGAAVLHGKRL
ncbi:MAG: GNAT family N-acetyltransferase [Oscillospiraceae bacterium]|jgi:hypothetical protein|nr:GNAT family N-acetyltransferase [Oscillospiraceae bacterium]